MMECHWVVLTCPRLDPRPTLILAGETAIAKRSARLFGEDSLFHFADANADRVDMNPLLKQIRHSPMLWLLAFVPVALGAARLAPTAHTLLFVFSVLAIVPLAALLSHATESVAERTGDVAGGLVNATLGNLTELVIATAALQAGECTLVKGSVAGAIVTNTLFMLGASFLIGGLPGCSPSALR
jgi:uncharacterized SAM-dependent methyltransferase